MGLQLGRGSNTFGGGKADPGYMQMDVNGVRPLMSWILLDHLSYPSIYPAASSFVVCGILYPIGPTTEHRASF